MKIDDVIVLNSVHDCIGLLLLTCFCGGGFFGGWVIGYYILYFYRIYFWLDCIIGVLEICHFGVG